MPLTRNHIVLLIGLICISLPAIAIPPRVQWLVEPQHENTTDAHPLYAPAAQQTAMPLNIAPRGLVILIGYQDIPFSTPHDTIDTLLNGSNFSRKYDFTYEDEDYHVQSNGSARQYFEACSFGHYSPHFDVVGPVLADKNMSNYNDANAQLLLKEAVEKADAMGVDFSQYDNDHDGNVDFVYMMYAGYAESDGGGATTIWPHAGNLTKYNVTLDGKRIYKYACGSELNYWSNRYYGIGMFCHEFGHVLGLKDLYQTNCSNYSVKTMGSWDIMDQGCYNNDANTPPTYSAYERFFLGWLTPTVLNEPDDITMSDILSSNQAGLISITDNHNLVGNDPDPVNFYMLENRQQTGWDEHIEGHGLLITKIQYNYNTWYANSINSDVNNLRVDLIEADGIAPEAYDDGWYGKPGDCFPEGATEYTAISNYPVTDITETDGKICFRIKGGKPTPTDNMQVSVQQEPYKFLHNGNIFIHKDGKIFNLIGQQQ